MQQNNWSSGIDWSQLPIANQMQSQYQNMMQPTNQFQGFYQAPQSTNLNWGNATAWNNPSQTPNAVSSIVTSPLDLNSTGTGWQGFGNALGQGWKGFEGLLSGDSGKALGTAFVIGSQLAGAWTGMQQLKLANKQFNLQKDLMNKNYAAQRGLTNTRLRDRQNARNAADSNFYQDTNSYMKENEVK